MGTDLFLRMGLDGPNQLDPAQQIRFCAQAVSTHVHGRPCESRDPYQMRLDRFAADLPVGQIGAVTFALSPSLRGATRRSNPAFFVAATKLDCFRLRSSSYGGQVAEPVIGRAFARPVGSQ